MKRYLSIVYVAAAIFCSHASLHSVIDFLQLQKLADATVALNPDQINHLLKNYDFTDLIYTLFSFSSSNPNDLQTYKQYINNLQPNKYSDIDKINAIKKCFNDWYSVNVNNLIHEYQLYDRVENLDPFKREDEIVNLIRNVKTNAGRADLQEPLDAIVVSTTEDSKNLIAQGYSNIQLVSPELPEIEDSQNLIQQEYSNIQLVSPDLQVSQLAAAKKAGQKRKRLNRKALTLEDYENGQFGAAITQGEQSHSKKKLVVKETKLPFVDATNGTFSLPKPVPSFNSSIPVQSFLTASQSLSNPLYASEQTSLARVAEASQYSSEYSPENFTMPLPLMSLD